MRGNENACIDDMLESLSLFLQEEVGALKYVGGTLIVDTWKVETSMQITL